MICILFPEQSRRLNNGGLVHRPTYSQYFTYPANSFVSFLKRKGEILRLSVRIKDAGRETGRGREPGLQDHRSRTMLWATRRKGEGIELKRRKKETLSHGSNVHRLDQTNTIFIFFMVIRCLSLFGTTDCRFRIFFSPF